MIKISTKKNEWIDISVAVKSGMACWPGDPAVCITRLQNMDKGDSTNVSLISMGSHTGTHIDAPYHFFSRGMSSDKIPVDAFMGPVRVLAIRNKQHITVEELKQNKIKRNERIIFKTKNSLFWKYKGFQKNFVSLTQESAEYLVSCRVSLVGVDYLSVSGYHDDGAKIHTSLLGTGIWILEGLYLSGVIPGNYDLICLPLKILNSDGAPARAIVRRHSYNKKDPVSGAKK